MTKNEFIKRELADVEERIVSYRRSLEHLLEKRNFLIQMRDGTLEGEQARLYGDVPDEDHVCRHLDEMRTKHSLLPEEVRMAHFQSERRKQSMTFHLNIASEGDTNDLIEKECHDLMGKLDTVEGDGNVF